MMKATLLSAAGASLALGTQLRGQPQPIMATAHIAADSTGVDQRGFSTAPDWDTKTVHDGPFYHADYPKDDRPNMTNTTVDHWWSHVSVTTKEGHEEGSLPWFKSECTKINEHCDFVRDHRLTVAKEDIEYLYNEYMRQKGIYDDLKGDHKEEGADVVTMKNQIADAKLVVEAKAGCRPKLEQARARWETLEAIADKTPSDIEEECAIEKKVVELEKCVDELVVAEHLLARHHVALPGEREDREIAENLIPPQEPHVIEAKARWDQARSRPLEAAVYGIDEQCQGDRDELNRKIGLDVDGLWEYWQKQKRIYGNKEDDAADQKADVSSQKSVVADVEAQVKAAEKDVRANAHCPPELEKAEAELARLEAIPNKAQNDIDAECKAENVVLEAQKCVDILRAAELVLSRHMGVHDVERRDLSGEKGEAAAAHAELSPQQSKVAAAKQAWLDAKGFSDKAWCSKPQ
jgi:hypothetical protein